MKVLIKEYLERVVDIDTDDSAEALREVRAMVKDGDIILTPDDFTGRDISIWNDNQEVTF